MTVHKEFVSSGNAVNAELYENILIRLCKRITNVTPEL